MGRGANGPPLPVGVRPLEPSNVIWHWIVSDVQPAFAEQPALGKLIALARDRLQRASVGVGLGGLTIRPGDYAGIGFDGELAIRVGQEVTVANVEKIGFGFRAAHVVQKGAGRVYALADEIEILLHLVHV